MATLPGLHTKHEMSLFVPNRTWQRWVQERTAPAPFQIDGFNRKVRLFFEGSLVPIALGSLRTSPAARAALLAVQEETQGLFASGEFQQLSQVLRAHLGDLPETNMTAIGTLLDAVAPQAVVDFAAAVRQRERALLLRSVEFRTVRAMVVDTTATMVRLLTVDGEELDVSNERFAARGVAGAEAIVKHVTVGGISGVFVLPSMLTSTEDTWKTSLQTHLNDVTAAAASDDGTVERTYAFLYRWDPETIDSWKVRAADALAQMAAPTDWDAFLTASRQEAGALVIADAPAVSGREPAGVLVTGDRDGWERRLLDAPSPLAALPRRRRR